MSPLLLFLVGCVPSFAAGALARPYIDRLIEEAHVHPTTEKQKRRWRLNVVNIMLTFTTVVACGGFIYSINAEQADDARYEAFVDCLSSWSQESSSTTLARSDAAEQRDEALVNSKKAMRSWVQRVLAGESLENSPAIREAALQYIAQTGRFIAAQEALDATRKHEPVTLFTEAYCRKVAERKDADR